MRVIFLLVILCSATSVWAQEESRQWYEGDLTWSDFRSQPRSSAISQLAYTLGYHRNKRKSNDTTYIEFATSATMYPHMSWIVDEYRIDRQLAYNQIVFDLVELHRRRLQAELERARNLAEANADFVNRHNALRNDIGQYQTQADSGSNIVAIERWRRLVNTNLRQTAEVPPPTFRKARFGYGFNVGFGAGFYTGDLARNFHPGFNFMFGFDLAYGHSLLYLNGTMSFTRTRAAYKEEDFWTSGTKTHGAILDLSYGYAIVDIAKWKCAPFAGLGVTEFSQANHPKDVAGWGLVDYSPIFGFNADYKFHKRMNLVPNAFFGVREVAEASIRTRLYVTHADYSSDLRGFTIHFSVGIAGFGRILRFVEGG